MKDEQKSDSGHETFFARLMRREDYRLRRGDVPLLVAGALLFFAMLSLQGNPRVPFLLKGALAQVQVLISIFVTAVVPRRGFITMGTCNLIAALVVGVTMFVQQDFTLLSGVIVPIGTYITVSVLALLFRQLFTQYREVRQQQQSLQRAHDEIEAREEEVEAQNRQLVEYSKILEENERQLAWLATYDSLTALPNRKRLMDRLGARIHALEEEGRNLPGEGREIAVAFIDLDNFKQINDSAGHHVGDQVLNIAVSRMQGLLHEEDLLGRLGGDEFALLVNRPMREQEMFQYMEELRKALEQPVELGNYVFSISGSFGVAVYPQDGRSVTDLLKCADTAMYKAKESGRNVIRFFDRQMEEEIRERMEMESLLVNAIEREEIHLVYQPQFQTSTLQIRGVEALARWQSTELGNIPPDKFIPLAEAQGFILPLGKWVLRNACMDMRRLQEDLGRRFILAVNISAAQIYHPLFVDMVREVLEETGYPAEWLELEITESVVIASFESVVRHLDALRALGVGIALDDFGTGFSSLYYLQELPIDILKVDRSFIQNIGAEAGRDQVVSGIILLSHRLGLSVVAEGVETEPQRQFLRAHACDMLQGFLLARPLRYEALQSRMLEEKASGHTSQEVSTVIQ
jgi:diguanylate cyclase (GGDEF)-like protein